MNYLKIVLWYKINKSKYKKLYVDAIEEQLQDL